LRWACTCTDLPPTCSPRKGNLPEFLHTKLRNGFRQRVSASCGRFSSVAEEIITCSSEVTSPTFTLVHVYGKAAKVFHADLYRIESFHNFETLGLEDVFAKPAVVILEWSERFPLQLPWPQVRIRLEHHGGDSRRITVL